jgi:hypothetical protein
MVRLSFFDIEGTPEEVIRVSRELRPTSGQVNGQVAIPERSEAVPANASANGASVTTDLVLRVLTRRDLSDDIKKDLKALMKAGPKGLSSEELAKAVGIDRGQLAGVHGAFGRRIANTPGWPTGVRMIEKYRDENGQKRHRLLPVVRAALEKFDL